jgi:hypothetical protein
MVNFEEIKKNTDLPALAGMFVPLKKVGKEHKGPCPLCGGSDRFHVFSDGLGCHCRKCERSWDAISLYAAIKNIGQLEAAQILAGEVGSAPHIALPHSDPITRRRDEDWIARAKTICSNAEMALERASVDSLSREYLLGRGVGTGTTQAFRIGFDGAKYCSISRARRPALVLPWIDESSRVFAVKYRFIDDLAVNADRRFSQLKDSDPILFGGHLPKESSRLVCIEGEFNALSVFEACSGGTSDVISFGSESNRKGLQVAAELAKRRSYRVVAVWCDSESKCRTAAEQFTGIPLVLIKSPGGLDANDILVKYGAGCLRGLIASRLNDIAIGGRAA